MTISLHRSTSAHKNCLLWTTGAVVSGALLAGWRARSCGFCLAAELGILGSLAPAQASSAAADGQRPAARWQLYTAHDAASGKLGWTVISPFATFLVILWFHFTSKGPVEWTPKKFQSHVKCHILPDVTCDCDSLHAPVVILLQFLNVGKDRVMMM